MDVYVYVLHVTILVAMATMWTNSLKKLKKDFSTKALIWKYYGFQNTDTNLNFITIKGQFYGKELIQFPTVDDETVGLQNLFLYEPIDSPTKMEISVPLKNLWYHHLQFSGPGVAICYEKQHINRLKIVRYSYNIPW